MVKSLTYVISNHHRNYNQERGSVKVNHLSVKDNVKVFFKKNSNNTNFQLKNKVWESGEKQYYGSQEVIPLNSLTL